MSHFNKEASHWDSPEKIKMMKALAQESIKALKLDGKLDILDFGCGTGLYGLEFGDFAQTLTGVDTSQGMLDVFDKKIQGCHHIKSINIDLEKEDLEEKFDLILSSMAFHHLLSPSKTLGKFKSMLNPDGRIAIADLDEEDGTFHPDNAGMGVKHFGFSKQELKAWALENDMKLDHSIIHAIEKNNRAYKIFLAVFGG